MWLIRPPLYYLDSQFGQQTIPQPTGTTRYILNVRNNEGVAELATSVNATLNAVITNFRRTAFQQNPGTQSGTFWFSAQIRGAPQPTLSYRFGNGRQGSITSRHLSAGAVNSWTFSWSVYHSVLADSLTLTATNSSNTTTATISNIST